MFLEQLWGHPSPIYRIISANLWNSKQNNLKFKSLSCDLKKYEFLYKMVELQKSLCLKQDWWCHFDACCCQIIMCVFKPKCICSLLNQAEASLTITRNQSIKRAFINRVQTGVTEPTIMIPTIRDLNYS